MGLVSGFGCGRDGYSVLMPESACASLGLTSANAGGRSADALAVSAVARDSSSYIYKERENYNNNIFYSSYGESEDEEDRRVMALLDEEG